MNLRELSVGERPQVNAFYRKTAYKRPVSGDDRVFVAEMDGVIYGAARIESRDGVQVLRGMYVHPEMLRQGIGSRLLSYLSPSLALEDSYCIPGAHLLDFYGRVNFRPIESDSAPSFLVERINSYLSEGKQVAMMYRPAG